jgi:hypothetical protein
VVVPGHARSDDEVAAAHDELVTLDRGVGALAVEHEADGIGGVAMGGRDLARQQVLHGDRDRVAGRALGHAGVVQAQDTPLGTAARRHELGAAVDERLDVAPAPEAGPHRRGLGLDERAGLQPRRVEPGGTESGRVLLAGGPDGRHLNAHRRASFAPVYCSRRVSSSGWLSIG